MCTSTILNVLLITRVDHVLLITLVDPSFWSDNSFLFCLIPIYVFLIRPWMGHKPYPPHKWFPFFWSLMNVFVDLLRKCFLWSFSQKSEWTGEIWGNWGKAIGWSEYQPIFAFTLWAVAAKPLMVDGCGDYTSQYIGDYNNPRTVNPYKPTRIQWNDVAGFCGHCSNEAFPSHRGTPSHHPF